jgi:hypothetical protein
MSLHTDEDIRILLRQACQETGSQKAWAKQHGLSGSYVTDVLQGRRDPGKSVLDALGWERVVGYRKMSNGQTKGSDVTEEKK